MRPQDIKADDLRRWVEGHIERRRETIAKAKRSTASCEHIWDSYDERDWEAVRALQDLRPRARDKGITDADIATAIRERLKRPPLTALHSGFHSDGTYTLALEAQVVEDLLWNQNPISSTTEIH